MPDVDDEVVALVERAREIPKEEIEDLPPVHRRQFARVRDDITVGDTDD